MDHAALRERLLGPDACAGLPPPDFGRSYDADGYDSEGYDRSGYDRLGRDRFGVARPSLAWQEPRRRPKAAVSTLIVIASAAIVVAAVVLQPRLSEADASAARAAASSYLSACASAQTLAPKGCPQDGLSLDPLARSVSNVRWSPLPTSDPVRVVTEADGSVTALGTFAAVGTWTSQQAPGDSPSAHRQELRTPFRLTLRRPTPQAPYRVVSASFSTVGG